MYAMLSFLASFVALLGFSSAQLTGYENTIGTRSLWIPYKTWSGVPKATIIGTDVQPNATTYVISCPTDDASCNFGPNITLTEGTEAARWMSSTSGSATSGTVVIGCHTLDDPPVVCNQRAMADGNVVSTSETVAPSDIEYRAIDVTGVLNMTAPATVTVTRDPETETTSSSTSTSTGEAHPMTHGGPWAMGGAVGAGLLAVAAL